MSDEQKQETPKAYAAFLEYCALGPVRSLEKLATTWKTYGKPTANLRQLETWSSAHKWQDRVKLYDAERAEEKRLKNEAAIDAMNERQALMGMEQQERAVAQIEELMQAKSFGSIAAVQLLKMATELERLARGADSNKMKIEHSGSIETTGRIAIVLPPKNPPPAKGGDAHAPDA